MEGSRVVVALVHQVYQQRQCLQQYLVEDKGNGRQDSTLKIMGEPNVGKKKHVQLQSLSCKGSVFLQLI